MRHAHRLRHDRPVALAAVARAAHLLAHRATGMRVGRRGKHGTRAKGAPMFDKGS